MSCFLLISDSECCVSIPDRPIIPSYRVAMYTSQTAQTRGYQPAGNNTQSVTCVMEWRVINLLDFAKSCAHTGDVLCLNQLTLILTRSFFFF